VTLIEAKINLLLYRAGTKDADDPEVHEALALAATNPELFRWLEVHGAGQAAVRDHFRRIAPPDGLKEQILSEFAASQRGSARRRFLVFAPAALLVVVALLAVFWPPRRGVEQPLRLYQNRMVRTALGGYAMNLLTNDLGGVRAYLAQRQAPADFTLPQSLQHATLMGCALSDWQGARVSLLCFRTGKPLPPGAVSDLWLFVVDRASVGNAPNSGAVQLARVSLLMTATWTDGNRLYFLGVRGEESDLRPYLL
jgi:hypothetical protein